ncbi:MAG: hypothetical protein KUG82_14910 [Pseudomonadales bacterium]|nr:hypothetical protein [Pseudomonadales bacterium]
MNGELYQVVFTGQILEGAELPDVKRKVAKLFNASDKQMKLFFSGKRVVIKNKINKTTAKKYQMALEKAGAQCQVEKLDVTPSAPVKEERPASMAPSNGAAPVASKDVVPNAIQLAPVGADLVAKSKDVPPPAPDVSHLSVSDLGATLGVESKEPPPPQPDITHISVAEAGVILVDKDDTPPPAAPDVSQISLAAAGESLLLTAPSEAPAPPDVSSISVAPLGSDLTDAIEEVIVKLPDVAHLSLE